MKKARFNRLLTQTYESLVSLTASKGEEYTRSADDQLANFRRDAVDFSMTVPQVIGIALNKHLNSIKTFIVDDASNVERQLAEPIYGRIDDAILYLLLLKASITEKKESSLGSPAG